MYMVTPRPNFYQHFFLNYSYFKKPKSEENTKQNFKTDFEFIRIVKKIVLSNFKIQINSMDIPVNKFLTT
jgi:hypothetical protein